MESIAGEWARKNIETVEEAMEIARKAHKSNEKFRNNKKVDTVKKVPVWFNKDDISMEEASVDEQKEMEELLKEYR